jgi:hypothetical protein
MLKSVLSAAIGAAYLSVAGSAVAENLKLRCANVASGTTWDIAIDLDNKRVDDQPAEIDAKSIGWRDPQSRIYELDRTSGALRMRNASSTGGYYLYYTCRPA